ncbi:MAG TPA: tetratricopeptide repeat protein [Bryobacteraceae bacterium]|nr:tetratricopeptide repeat protein [Bryobacteraceae bacterium]
MRPLAVILVTLALAVNGRAQAPSTEEQQYLFSVLPLIDRGELSRAEEQLTAGIERHPRSAILYNALGIVYRRENKLDRAVDSFRKALEILPSFTAAQLQLAAIHQQQGLKQDAADLFRTAGESTTNFEALMAAGLGLADCEDYAGAAQVLEKAHAMRPDAESVTYNLALAQYKMGNLPAALKTLNSNRADEPDAAYLRAKVLDGLGKSESASEFAAACRAQPGNEAFCADAALAAIRQQKYLEAVALLQPANEKSPDSVALLALLGLAQFRLGRYQEAIRSYVSSLKRDPGVDASREGLGFLYYVTGDLEKARAVVEQGLLNPIADFYLAYLDAIVLYRLSPRLRTKAAAALERAIQANSRFAPSYFQRGKMRMEQNDTAGALADFERAAELDPKYPLPYFKLTQIYARQGRLREAEAARRKFSALGNQREEEILARQTLDVLMPAAR